MIAVPSLCRLEIAEAELHGSLGFRRHIRGCKGKSDGACVNPPFYCDYGSHVEVGKNFFANYNCTILDVAKVTIGDNCFMAPNVAIYTADHLIYPDVRSALWEYGKEVTIGDNVWIGGNTVICQKLGW